MKRTSPLSWPRAGVVLLALIFSMPFIHMLGAPRPGPPRGAAGPPHGVEGPHGGEAERRPPMVERPYHGSIEHANVNVVRNEHVDVHRNYDVDVNHGFGPFWGGFVAGSVVTALPFGYQNMVVGGVPYYYAGGTYYQQVPSGYQVVNPPVGAALPEPSPDSIPIVANGQTYYYMDGTFYVQQDSGYAVVPAPLGVTVPELPGGASQVVINGNVYYQFNGVFYQPVMQNGTTMYVTVAPQ